MSLFKILKGDSSRISMDMTPFHDGWCYYTSDDGGFYIDSTEEDGGKKRTRINPEGTGGSTSRAVKATLAKNGWENGRQTLSIVGLRAAQNGVIGVTQDITEAQLEAAKSAELYVCGQSDDRLVIAASADIPDVDIPVAVVLLS